MLRLSHRSLTTEFLSLSPETPHPAMLSFRSHKSPSGPVVKGLPLLDLPSVLAPAQRHEITRYRFEAADFSAVRRVVHHLDLGTVVPSILRRVDRGVSGVELIFVSCEGPKMALLDLEDWMSVIEALGFAVVGGLEGGFYRERRRDGCGWLCDWHGQNGGCGRGGGEGQREESCELHGDGRWSVVDGWWLERLDEDFWGLGRAPFCVVGWSFGWVPRALELESLLRCGGIWVSITRRESHLHRAAYMYQ